MKDVDDKRVEYISCKHDNDKKEHTSNSRSVDKDVQCNKTLQQYIEEIQPKMHRQMKY